MPFGHSPTPLKPLLQRFRLSVVWLPVVVLTFATTAQITNRTLPKTPTPSAQELSPDPLGRSTPRGTITGFIREMDHGDFVTASRYMQVSAKQKRNTETLASDLKELMDRYFSQPLATISDAPTGVLNDGLPPDRERVGPLTIGGERVDILLVRVNNLESGPIWLISSETLARVPDLYDAIEETWIQRVMPGPLLNRRILGLSLAQCLVWIASIVIPLSLFWLLSRALIFFLKRTIRNPSHREIAESWHATVRWPSIVFLTLSIHLAFVSFLGFSLGTRIIYTRSGLALLVVALAWLVRRIATISFERARGMMQRRGQTGTGSLILLGERLFKVLIILAAIFAVLTIVGVDTKTALAGVGIGGVAVALGAQKTVENFLGGVFLLTDKALAVGDPCCISNRFGTVEDITLRSVRLRTLDQTLLSIPAGVLSQASIENFATRRKTLLETRLRLRYGTTAHQLRVILDAIHRLLAECPAIETDTARIRLVDFGAHSIELELFAYVLTADPVKFFALREDLLLKIAEVVDASGSCFAGQPQSIYIEQGPNMDAKFHELRMRVTSPEHADSNKDDQTKRNS